MKITVIQVDNNITKIEDRLKDIELKIEQAPNSDFVILTELSTPGYIPNERIWQYKEKNGELTKKWAVQIAKKYNIYLGAGYVEEESGEIYNSYLIANKDGIIGNIRKSEAESNIFKRGNFAHVIDTPIGKIAIAICFDAHKKLFYDAIKDENISMIIMPHAWPTDERRIKEDRYKIKRMITAYGDAFDCPVVFANAVGNVDKMSGITGKLMNPKKYKLNGHSSIYINGKIIEIKSNSDILSFECDIFNKERKKEILFFLFWIDKGSFIYRNIILPLDIKKGIKMYKNSKNNNFKILKCKGV